MITFIFVVLCCFIINASPDAYEPDDWRSRLIVTLFVAGVLVSFNADFFVYGI